VRVLVTQTIMTTPADRARLARKYWNGWTGNTVKIQAIIPVKPFHLAKSRLASVFTPNSAQHAAPGC
jgi:hypothetical protein